MEMFSTVTRLLEALCHHFEKNTCIQNQVKNDGKMKLNCRWKEQAITCVVVSTLTTFSGGVRSSKLHPF
ncbi:hypothetical protein L6164_003659 [Bauhinia variegata]|uniref:Uncharacterized protein n=1 Tax=Bauhinia variegata TaxID=167791 RepID=A0ACB9Q4P9_BAUVA|nr:hypothetical protein L6164_003659 [Bauhinia variegata]